MSKLTEFTLDSGGLDSGGTLLADDTFTEKQGSNCCKLIIDSIAKTRGFEYLTLYQFVEIHKKSSESVV